MPTTAYSRDWLNKQLRRRGTLLARYGTRQSTQPPAAVVTPVRGLRRLSKVPRGSTKASTRRAKDKLYESTAATNYGMPKEWDKAKYTLPPVPVASSTGVFTLDLETSNVYMITLDAANRVLQLINVTVGQRFMIRLEQGEVGGRTVTWFTTIRWATGGTPPVLTTTPGKADMLGFFCTSEGNFDGFKVGMNL